jgi:hypothetical protein
VTQQNPTATMTGAGNQELSSSAAADLSAAISTLTQAAQALTTTAGQMMQMMQTVTSGTSVGQAPSGAAPATQININTWEDDPFSEAIPTQNLPLLRRCPSLRPSMRTRCYRHRSSTYNRHPASFLPVPRTSASGW